MKYAFAAIALMLATPAFAEDAETLSQTSVYQAIPAHKAVADTFNGGDAETLAQAGAYKAVPAHQGVAAAFSGGNAQALDRIEWQALVAKAGR